MVRITGLTVNCVVGVFPRERNKVQPVVIDVDMHVPSEKAGVSERLRDTVDYSSVASEVAFLLRACHFRLLETAAHVIAKWLLLPSVEGDSRTARC